MAREKTAFLMLFATLFVFCTILFAYPQEGTNSLKAALVVRDLTPITNVWKNAISYSPYRDGQSPEYPGGNKPTYENIREDMGILEKNWGLIRIYSCDPVSELVLEVIEKEKFRIKVFLGAWISQYAQANEEEVSNLIRLAKRYKDIVPVVIVGNEVLVKWSDHKVPVEDMIGYIREVREAVTQPVSMADNYEFWFGPGARVIADELDFLTVHNYPLWDNKGIMEGMVYTKAYYKTMKERFPDRLPVYGEVGWATLSDNHYMRIAEANESNQVKYFTKVVDWASNNNVIAFYFDAFDENWKKSISGGPKDPEKHWGLFTTDRKPKPAVASLYPELAGNALTNSNQ